MRSSLAPLRVRAFRRLFVSYTVNEIGDSIGLIALALLVHAETGSALATAALFIALQAAPAFLAPALTARLDHVPLRRALPVLYLVEAAAFLGLALLAGSFVLPLILLLGLLDGTLALTGRSLTRAAVGAILEPDGQLREGNALLNVAFATAAVAGAAVGGILAGEAGIAAALAVDAASFLLISALLAATPGLPQVVETAKPLVVKLREGIGFVVRQHRVRLLIAGEAAAIVLFTIVVPIEVFYARDTLGADESGFGLLLASWGAGMLIGSLVFAVAKRGRLSLLVLGSTAVIGVAYTGMSAVDTLSAACLLSVLGGAGNGVQWVAVVTALQEATPAHLQARVLALLESVNRVAPAIGFLAGGLLVNAFSPRTAFAVAGCGVLLLTLGGIAAAARMNRRAIAGAAA